MIIKIDYEMKTIKKEQYKIVITSNDNRQDNGEERENV